MCFISIIERKDKEPEISLVIPFYNEERILSETIRRSSNYLSAKFGEYELILVDDGSEDDSLKIARKCETPSTRVLSHSPNRGKGYAVRRGMLTANGRTIFFSDADLPYGLDILQAAYSKLTTSGSGGTDIVVGSRRLQAGGYDKYPLIRRIASRSFVLATDILLNLGVSDSQCGFKGFRRSVAQELFSQAKMDRFTFDAEILYLARKKRFKISEIPVKVSGSKESSVRLWRDSLAMLWDLVKIRMRFK